MLGIILVLATCFEFSNDITVFFISFSMDLFLALQSEPWMETRVGVEFSVFPYLFERICDSFDSGNRIL